VLKFNGRKLKKRKNVVFKNKNAPETTVAGALPHHVVPAKAGTPLV
jgi:hypothetical protein